MSSQNSNFIEAQSSMISCWCLIDQLAQQGVRHFFFAPGSRNSPLLTAVKKHPLTKLYPHFDERGLGFFALGFAKASSKPVAIIVTSGTACGNLLPSIMEAFHTEVPMIVLTADRPAELRGVGANQATDQIKIFENYVHLSLHLDPGMPSSAIRSITANGVSRASQGPIHINIPIREVEFVDAPLSFGSPILIHEEKSNLIFKRRFPEKGLILLGKYEFPQKVFELAEKLKWPVISDIQASKRTHDFSIYRFDLFATPPKPECILHFGKPMTSKKLNSWLKKLHPAHYVHISSSKLWQDPDFLVTEKIQSSHFPFECEKNQSDTWLQEWKKLDQIEIIESNELTDSAVFQFLNKQNLETWALFLGNSMPIREANLFLFNQFKEIYTNRGLSGIDGNIATIAGIAKTAPVIAVIGDITALHDLNSLILLKDLPIICIILNNNGCGIFSHLPMSKRDDFEFLWGFSHHLEFKLIAEQFRINYLLVKSLNMLSNAFEQAIKNQTACLVEIKTDRLKNYCYHKQYQIQE
jgi:2-succinyl-5-enolpyruvyl-6-hydroxy-3-cyclohexene-1-carboxylate synthase